MKASWLILSVSLILGTQASVCFSGVEPTPINTPLSAQADYDNFVKFEEQRRQEALQEDFRTIQNEVKTEDPERFFIEMEPSTEIPQTEQFLED